MSGKKNETVGYVEGNGMLCDKFWNDGNLVNSGGILNLFIKNNKDSNVITWFIPLASTRRSPNPVLKNHEFTHDFLHPEAVASRRSRIARPHFELLLWFSMVC